MQHASQRTLTSWRSPAELIYNDKIPVNTTRLRHFLLCLMMLALPMQGFAAASMLFCGMAAGQTAKTEKMDAASSHHHPADSTGVQHDHKKPGKTAQVAKQSSDAQKQLPDASHKCGVCAACCNVIAIYDFPQTVKAQLSPRADLVEPFVLIHAVPSRLPDKPPRA